MRRLAIFVVHRRWLVLILTLIVLPIAAIFGSGAAAKLTVGGLEDPGSESARTAAVLSDHFAKSGQSDFVIVVHARKPGDVDSPAVARQGRAMTRQLGREAGVIQANSYWTTPKFGGASPLRSVSGQDALIFAALRGDLDQQVKLVEHLTPRYTRHSPALFTLVTGRAEVARQISKQAESDLQRSEIFSTPLTFIALIIVFGGIVAAFLPLAVGIVAVIGTLVILTVLAGLTDVSIFALNLTTGMGLGLAIDYSLFVVSRYREELALGASTNIAIGRTMQTAGRTVLFSAGTVMVSLLALLLFPVAYLRSFAYAGVAVVGLAGFASVIVLPAVLAVLGTRVEKLRVFKTKQQTESPFWGRQAARVMRHPVVWAVGVSTILLVLAVPFLRFNPGEIDDRVIPTSNSSRAATDHIRQRFSTREAATLHVYVPGADVVRDQAKIAALAKRMYRIPGVARVDAVTGHYAKFNGDLVVLPADSLSEQFKPDQGTRGTWLAVVPDVEPVSSAGEKLVKDLRATQAPWAFTVTGLSAQLVDTKDAVLSRLPSAIGVIAIATFLLLFLMTGSVLVPLKALALNVLSLTATFGTMVLIFQDGHLSDLMGFTATGAIDIFTPILMFCIAFGLSMDYEVFLLSRIKEEYDLDRDNERAVQVGLAKTGRIVTAAALLLTLVFVAIATGEVAIVKLFGLGLGLAVMVDAFLIRATLVPAFMRLAGRVNWWSPKWLRRWHLRYGIWENEPIALLDREFEARVG